MAYQIYQFNDVALPVYNAAQEHNINVASTLEPAIGGVADYFGSRRRMPQVTQFQITGIYSGDDYSLVTEGGAYLADESNNHLIAHSLTADLRMQLDALRAVIGTRGTLYRKRWDDLAVQWKTARLLQVRRSTQTDDRTAKAELQCTFDAVDALWRHSTQTTASGTLASGGTVTLVVANTGDQPVEDAQLTITASGGTITSVTVVCTAAGVSFTWAGSLASGSALVVDAGALTVRKDGVDSYSGFTLNSAHSARTWLPLAPGINSLQIASIGPGTASVAFYPQFL